MPILTFYKFIKILIENKIKMKHQRKSRKVMNPKITFFVIITEWS